MGDLTKWLTSKLAKVLIAYYAVVILLTYGIEWVGKHAVAAGIASAVTTLAVVTWRIMRWRRQRYW